MAAVSEGAEDEKELESAEDYTQELSVAHTSSPTTSTAAAINNNSVGPQQCQSLDIHQSLLNGAQQNPFVCGGVPAAPYTDDSLPLGALVNGPGSHRTSQEPHVPNKDASPWPGTDTNPEVLQPPSELQSDTSRKPEGHVLKVPPARTSSESDNSDCEAPPDAVVGGNAGNSPISRVWITEAIKAGPCWDVASESSESSSDNYDDQNGLQEKFVHFLLKGGAVGGTGIRKPEVECPPSTGLRRRKRKIHTAERMPNKGDINNGFGYASLSDKGLDFDLSNNEEPVYEKEEKSFKMCADTRLGNFSDKVVAAEKLVSSEEEGGDCGEEEPYVGGRSVKMKLETDVKSEIFRCTKCNINFKEKRHLHRHMMYHLERNNQVGQECVLRPFICKECGRSFRERSSLHKHTLIHQTRRERLMQEIKGGNESRDKEREARLQCPQCTFRTNCPKTFVCHSKMHEDKHYYHCKECSHVATSELEMEAHQQTAHLDACQGRFVKNLGMFLCKICTFRTKHSNVLKKHFELIHDQPFYNYELESHNNAVDHASPDSDRYLLGQNDADSSPPLSPNPDFLRETEDMRNATGLSVRPNGLADFYVKDKGTQKSCKGLNSSLIKWSFGSLANNLSPSSPRCDKPSKLSRPSERIDVTTGLYVDEDNQEYESAVCEQKTKYLSGFDTHHATKTTISGNTAHLNRDTANTSEDPGGGLAAQTPRQKSPSKRKMSIPYHNTPKNAPLIVPKCEPVSPEWQDSEFPQAGCYDDANNPDEDSLANYANNANDANYHSDTLAELLGGEEDGRDPFATCYVIRQGFSFQDDSCDSANLSDQDGNTEDSDEIRTLIVKEESIESPVSEDHSEYADHQSDPYSSYLVSSVFEIDRKSCPYCPAVFESGVGLSNHVRGHLHRLGLSYDARHMLSREQVASHDRQPRVRRRASSMNRTKRDKSECQTEHTCPLCLGWFDTKTGLSNHVRGHLKRIGKPISGLSKSPVCILTELLQDENEHQNIVRALQAKPHLSRPFVSQKFSSSEGLFLTPTGVPVKVQRASRTPNPSRRAPAGLLFEDEQRRKRREMNGISTMPSSTLVELLKRQRLERELEVTGRSQAARTRLMVPRDKSASPEGLPEELSSSCSQEKLDVNKRVCVHCNATFHSAVSLSNHLRAYARRKRLALQEGTSYECSQKRPRSRAGPRRKTLLSTHTGSEVIYRLACRFCDLVFQGPQSVQEDWVKHLQRHLMNSSVPGSGAAMVEVTAVCEEECVPLPLTQLTQGLP